MAKFKVGLIGLGTVGTGVYKTLQNFNDVETKFLDDVILVKMT